MRRSAWIAGGALALLYVLTGRFGLGWFHALENVATTVWPPTGLSLAALVLFGPRLWPAVTLGALLVNFDRLPPALAVLVAVGNTSEAVTGAWILRRLRFDPALARVRDVLLLVVAAIAGASISATLGTIATAVARGIAEVPFFWSTWLVGDVLGDLVVASLVLAWLTSGPVRARVFEAAVLGLAVASFSAVVFLDVLLVPEGLRQIYVLFPLLAWAALRFGPRGATSATFAVASIALLGTAMGSGPYSAREPEESLLLLQAFMAVVAVTMLILAASGAERQKAIDLREEFLSIASHELKTPITALKIRVQMARGAVTESRELDIALAQIDRLARLVEQLLDVARTGRGGLQIEKAPLELGPLVHEVVERHRQEIERTGSTLAFDTDPDVRGSWDRLRLEQVVDNLLSNATRHAPGKPVVVLVSRSGESRARIAVADSGPGVSEEDRTAIFQRFSRRGSQGLGLGLYIAKQIVEAHGGEIHVEATPGGGATFVVDLPV